MKRFRVALLANLKKNAPCWVGMPEDQWDDLDGETTIQALVEAIRAGGHTCEFLEGDITIVDTVRKFKPDICFNICESHFGDAREAQVPAILEKLRIPYTGSQVTCLALTLDKPMTKRILTYHDLPTPEFQTFERVDEPLDPKMQFPLFVKPSREGTGMGVSAKSIVRDERELREQVRIMVERYQQAALVETYIEGREVTVGLVGNLVGPVARRIPQMRTCSHPGGVALFRRWRLTSPFFETDIVYDNRLKVDLADQLTTSARHRWTMIWLTNSTGWRAVFR